MVASRRSVEIRLGQPLGAALPQEPAAHVGRRQPGGAASRVGRRCVVTSVVVGGVRDQHDCFAALVDPYAPGPVCSVSTAAAYRASGVTWRVVMGADMRRGGGHWHTGAGSPVPDGPISADSPAPDFRALVARPEAPGHPIPLTRAGRCPCWWAPWSLPVAELLHRWPGGLVSGLFEGVVELVDQVLQIMGRASAVSPRSRLRRPCRSLRQCTPRGTCSTAGRGRTALTSA